MDYLRRKALLTCSILAVFSLLFTSCSRGTESTPPPVETEIASPSLPTETPTRPPTDTPVMATDTATPTETEIPTPLPIPSDTPTSIPQPGGNVPCPGALPTRLKVGIYAYVVTSPWIPNRIRTGPGLGYPAKGFAQPGRVMRIIGGPICGTKQLWWKVDLRFSELAGWIAEGDEFQYWIAPCPEEGHCPPLP